MDPNATPPKPILKSEQELKEYVRTFAQDMETFKKGGVPELHPLEKNPVEKVVAAALPVPPPPALTKPTPPPTPVDSAQPAPTVAKAPAQTIGGSSLQEVIDDGPKKYIRTFAGDMEILKSGGRPDLKPLEKKPVEVPAPKVPEEPTAAPMPVELPYQPPPPKPMAPVYVPPQPPPTPVPPPPQVQVPAIVEPKPSPLETYSNDFLNRVQEKRASTAAVLAAQEDSRTGAPKLQQSSEHNALPIIAGAVLLLLGAAGAYIAYTHYQLQVPVAVFTPTVTTPITVDEKQKIAGATPEALKQAIAQSVARPLQPHTVRLLYTDAATTTGRSLFSELRFPAPDVLLRNITANKSMMGVVNAGDTQSPFFILSVVSYSDTFAGMLAWEASMISDMNDLYPSYPAPVVVPTIATTTIVVSKATKTRKAVTRVATTTVMATSTPAIQPTFHDEVIANHDARVYRDSAGRVIMVYGYWNRSTLVIARDPEAFSEVLGRLATSRAQ